jgi:hypothetical protein
MLAIIRVRLFLEREKGNQRNQSNILFSSRPLGGRVSSMGDDCPTELAAPHGRPLPMSPPWPFHLPLCLRENGSSPREAWLPMSGLPPAPSLTSSGLFLGLLLRSAELLFPPCWLIHTFLLVKSNFQMQEWNISENQGLSNDKATWGRAHGRKSDTVNPLPSPLFKNI